MVQKITRRNDTGQPLKNNSSIGGERVSSFLQKKPPCIALQGGVETNMHLASSGRLLANSKGGAGSGVPKVNVQFIVVMFVSVSHRLGNQT